MLETEATFCCTQCSHRTIWPFQLDNHIQRHHVNAKLFRVTEEPKPYPYDCCQFSRYEHYLAMAYAKLAGGTVKKNHIEPGRSYDCDNICQYRCHSSLSLVEHVHECEMAPKPATVAGLSGAAVAPTVETGVKLEQVQWFNCAYCSYRSNKRARLTRHSLVECPFQTQLVMPTAAEDAVKWFHCTECSYRSDKMKNLKQHRKIHAAADQIKWFNCADCSYRSIVKKNLAAHMQKHSDAWQYCTQCPYRGKELNLKQHVRLKHTPADQIKWFSCAKCSYRGKQSSLLKTHMLTHATAEEIDWFCCGQCSYRGKRKRYLTDHVNTVHRARADNIG